MKRPFPRLVTDRGLHVRETIPLDDAQINDLLAEWGNPEFQPASYIKPEELEGFKRVCDATGLVLREDD